MEKKIVLADSIINNTTTYYIAINEAESVLAPSIDELFTYETIFEKMRSLIQCGAKLDSITYIGHNWFKVSYDLTDWYNTESGDEDGLALLYWKINKVDDKFKLRDVAYAYSQCTSYIEDLPVADRIKFWFNTIKYDDVQPYFQGNICKVRNDDKYGFINIEGIEILPCKYDNVAFVMGDLIKIDEQEIVYDDSRDSLLHVKLDNKYGLINLDGKEITPCKYVNLTLFTEYEYLFKTELDNKFGLINFDGKEIIPCKYDDLTTVTYEEISDDLIFFKNYGLDVIKSKSNNKYGLIRINTEQLDSEGFTIVGGKEILPCIFDKLETNDWGMVKAKRDNLWSYYTIDGTKVTEFYEDIKYYYDMDNPMFAAKLNGKWGYINKAGDVLISFVLDNAGKPHEDGTASVEYNGQWGELDLNTGRFSLQEKCSSCDGTGKVEELVLRPGVGLCVGTIRCQSCGGLGYIYVFDKVIK